MTSVGTLMCRAGLPEVGAALEECPYWLGSPTRCSKVGATLERPARAGRLGRAGLQENAGMEITALARLSESRNGGCQIQAS